MYPLLMGSVYISTPPHDSSTIHAMRMLAHPTDLTLRFGTSCEEKRSPWTTSWSKFLSWIFSVAAERLHVGAA